jgi:hypothetical protein
MDINADVQYLGVKNIDRHSPREIGTREARAISC